MRVQLSIICLIVSISYSSTKSYGQTSVADSCGLDSKPILNKYEIVFIDSLLFHPYSTKKTGVIDPKDGFDFTSKKIAFYSCTINSNTKGKGLISKEEFFNIIKPTPKGHAGIGLLKFTQIEKTNSKGYDAVIIIDCPYNTPDKKELILKILDSN
jgi:hypothetical protein